MAIQIPTHCLQGLTVLPVQMEVDVSKGMPIFSIIGMAGTSVQEAKDRVRSAMVQSGFEFPLTRKVVNLAPADLGKQGSHFDLPMALGFLMASGQMGPLPRGVRVMGELGLDGSVRGTSGVLPAVLFAREEGVKEVILPCENLAEASLVEGIKLTGVTNLREAVTYLEKGEPVECKSLPWQLTERRATLDFADISGHAPAKRALLVAAAGGHHILMNGPPGSGKSLLAEAFPGLLPPLSRDELLEVLRIYSIAGRTIEHFSLSRPFRAVHSRSTPFALLGGGVSLAPGEISLAHRGVLFMDEFPEFDRVTLEALRQPLESAEITLKYGKKSSSFPCQFQLIAAQNPCPCGHLGDGEKICRCTAAAVKRYQTKISGPILDRIDLHITVPRLPYEDFRLSSLETTVALREKVLSARERQAARLDPDGFRTNQEMTPRLLKTERLDLKTEELLKTAVHYHSLSGRAIHRVIKVARTLADLEAKTMIEAKHLMEALQYRIKA